MIVGAVARKEQGLWNRGSIDKAYGEEIRSKKKAAF
jgi:hypothetical protein